MGAEGELVIESGVLDLTWDAHVHTGFAAGRDSIGVVASAADRVGLRALTFADQIGPETTWLPAYADAVRRARLRTELTLNIGAEVEVVRPDGWLAWPADLGQLEAISVAVSRLPSATGLIGAREVRALLAAGALTGERLAGTVVEAMIKGIERASRYVPTRLARPLSLLSRVGVADEAITAEMFEALVAALRTTGTAVEVSEAWRSPSSELVQRLRGAGVALLAASDARYADDVGHWQYLRRI